MLRANIICLTGLTLEQQKLLPSPNEPKIIHHHTKYIETHGVDEFIHITESEHHRINHRLLFPTLSQKELMNVSGRACARLQKSERDAENERARRYIEFVLLLEHRDKIMHRENGDERDILTGCWRDKRHVWKFLRYPSEY